MGLFFVEDDIYENYVFYTKIRFATKIFKNQDGIFCFLPK